MPGPMDVRLSNEMTAFQAFHDLTVDRRFNKGTIEVVRNGDQVVTELKCMNHHFWQRGQNDSSKVTQQSVEDLRRVFENAVDQELESCFNSVLDRENMRTNLSAFEQNTLREKVGAIKDAFHAAIQAPRKNGEAKLDRSDIKKIVLDVSALKTVLTTGKYAVDKLLRMDVQDLCRLASSSAARKQSEAISGENAERHAAMTKINVAVEAMKKCPFGQILSAGESLVHALAPDVRELVGKKSELQKFLTDMGTLSDKDFAALRKKADAVKEMVRDQLYLDDGDDDLSIHIDKDLAAKIKGSLADYEEARQKWEVEAIKSKKGHAAKGQGSLADDDKGLEKCDVLSKFITAIKTHAQTQLERVSASIVKHGEMLRKYGVTDLLVGEDGSLKLREGIREEERQERVEAGVRKLFDVLSKSSASWKDTLRNVEGFFGGLHNTGYDIDKQFGPGKLDIDAAGAEIKKLFQSEKGRQVRFFKGELPKPVEPPKTAKVESRKVDASREEGSDLIADFKMDDLGCEAKEYMVEVKGKKRFNWPKFVDEMKEACTNGACKGKNSRFVIRYMLDQWARKDVSLGKLQELKKDARDQYEQVRSEGLLKGYLGALKNANLCLEECKTAVQVRESAYNSDDTHGKSDLDTAEERVQKDILAMAEAFCGDLEKGVAIDEQKLNKFLTDKGFPA